MTRCHAWAERIRRGDPIPLGLALLLATATPAVRLGMWRRLRQPRTRVNAHVVSFGNITAGGTGKTPAVIQRAQQEIRAGHRVAVVTRGYGARRQREPVVILPGTPREGLAGRIGDEPALIARRVPEAVIVRSADRIAGARTAIEEHHCDTVILDDGFQYVALERDENILLIDATNPFGNGHLLPRGILREPLAAVARATAVFLSRCDQSGNIAALAAQLAALCPGIPIRRTYHAPRCLWRVSDGSELPLSTLAEGQVTAVCGIGNPEAFFQTLESAGARIGARRAYPDHARIPAEEIPRSGIVVTTEKDAVRMQDVGDNVLALGIELRDLPAVDSARSPIAG